MVPPPGTMGKQLEVKYTLTMCLTGSENIEIKSLDLWYLLEPNQSAFSLMFHLGIELFTF